MKQSLYRIYYAFFIMGMFFLSFNEYEGINVLGEFKREAGALFLFAGFLILIIDFFRGGKLSLPLNSFVFQILLFFLAWCIITTLINYPSVSLSYFKHTSGTSRFIRQYVALLISTLIFFTLYWNVIIRMELNDILYKIRKVFLCSLVFATIYGFLETLNRFFGIGSLTHVLRLFNYFPFTEVNYHIEGRISSFCFEPPFLAIYLTTIAGWMFSYILTEKGVLKFVPTICVVLLTYFSGSRTGLLVVFFQVFIFGIMLYRDQRYKKYIRTSITAFIAVASLLMIINGEKIFKSVSEKVESLDFSSNMKTNVSNKSRFGLQYASIQVFKEHPIIGVGFGQQTYFSRLHYPFWATNNNWEFKEMYKNKNDLSFPPGYNLYTRLLAETGLVGTLLFLALIYLSVKIARQTMRNSVGDKRILAMIVYISLIGLYINWLQIDAFRIYGVWLSLAILIRFSYNTKKHE